MKLRTGARETVQWVKCLLYKHEDLGLDPPADTHKSQACACNPSVGDIEIGRSQGPFLQPVKLKQ